MRSPRTSPTSSRRCAPSACELGVLLWAIEYLLPADRRPAALLAHVLGRAAPADREAHHRPHALLRELSKLRVLFVAGYYDDPRAQADIGVARCGRSSAQLPAARGAGRPRRARRRSTRPCAIGSARAGRLSPPTRHGTAAGSCCSRRGRRVRGGQMTGRENEMSALLFKESGLQSTVDLGMTVLQGRVLGGTTLIGNCICFRLDDPAHRPGRHAGALGRSARRSTPRRSAALRRRRSSARRSRAIPERLDRRQRPSARSTAGARSRGPRRGRAGRPADWFRKNFDDCGAAGVRNWGCPHHRKASALET